MSTSFITRVTRAIALPALLLGLAACEPPPTTDNEPAIPEPLPSGDVLVRYAGGLYSLSPDTRYEAGYLVAAAQTAKCPCTGTGPACAVSIINPGTPEQQWTCSTATCTQCTLTITKTTALYLGTVADNLFDVGDLDLLAEVFTASEVPPGGSTERASCGDRNEAPDQTATAIAAFVADRRLPDAVEPRAYVEVQHYEFGHRRGAMVVELAVDDASDLVGHQVTAVEPVSTLVAADPKLSCACSASGNCKLKQVSRWPGPNIWTCEQDTCTGYCSLTISQSSSQ